MKKTWRTINETLNRNRNSSNVPSLFYHIGKNLSNLEEIANAFNVYILLILEKNYLLELRKISTILQIILIILVCYHQ